MAGVVNVWCTKGYSQMRVNSCDLQLINPCIYIYIYSFIDVIHVLAKNAKGLKLKETMSVI